MHCLSLHKDPMRALSISSCCCTGLSWLLERFSSRESLETASMAFLFWWGMCSYSPCWKKTRGTLNPKHVQITNPHTMIPAPHRWMTWVTLSGWSFIAISLGDHHLHCHLQSSRESLETASMAFLFWWGMCSYSPCWKKTRGTLNPKHVQITNPHTMIPAPHQWMTWVTLSGWSFIAISLGDHHLHCHLQTVSCIVVLIATIERFLLRLVPAEVRKIA